MPFALTPDPNFLFLSESHREALAALIAGVAERKGLVVVTGQAGTGKSTLVRKLVRSFPAGKAQFSVIVNPAMTRAELLETILMDFGVDDVPASKAQRLSLFRRLLMRAYHDGRTSVLVVDEAHLLTEELLEEIRLLSNFETAEHTVLQIVLAGQSELGELLARPAVQPLRQRIAMRVRIQPLAPERVGAYLEARWRRCSVEAAHPFRPEAVRLIADYSGGIPRLINVICDAALVNASGRDKREIGAAEILEVACDNELLPLAGPSTGVGEAALKLRPSAGAATVETEFLSDRVRLTRADFCRVPLVAETKGADNRKFPKLWDFANWFGTAAGSAK